MTFREWWHHRTDEVEGIHKLIGEPGSPWRQNVIYRGGLIVAGIVFLWLTKDRPE